MNNSIENILSELKKGKVKTYNQYEIHLIYKYITNLEEENETYNNFLIDYGTRLNNGIKYIKDRMILEQAFCLDRKQCDELLIILEGNEK